MQREAAAMILLPRVLRLRLGINDLRLKSARPGSEGN